MLINTNYCVDERNYFCTFKSLKIFSRAKPVSKKGSKDILYPAIIRTQDLCDLVQDCRSTAKDEIKILTSIFYLEVSDQYLRSSIH